MSTGLSWVSLNISNNVVIGEATILKPPNLYDVKIVDGPAIVHSLSANCKFVKTFDGYADSVFLARIDTESIAQ